MTDKLKNEIEAIFMAALQIPNPDDQAAYVEQACAEDRELLNSVQQLMRAHQESRGPLDEPVHAEWRTPPAPSIAEQPGTRIGRYKLLEQIGEGGMGVVYMAEQVEPVQRKVALKIIKPGMDSRQVISRFEAERQALAVMDHPNIAKVLDGGMSETGRPFFVMELVKGIPLTQYCDEQQLSPRERLKLFIPICLAVQHAHQKGIIHRDIKPSNILVAHYDDVPVPKVIDFGVAKAIGQKLSEKTAFTGFGQIVGTIEYMSPEQARFNQLDIDTRSDIYSLGVVLYELLVGETPFGKQRLRKAAFDEVLRIIREEEPPNPSTRLSASQTLPSIAANRKTEPKRLSLLVRGELDWIVMKALEKNRTGRYGTASKFAEDIQHFLDGEPVGAYPISPYRKLWRWYVRQVPYLAPAFTMLTFCVLLLMQIGLCIVTMLFGRLAESYGLVATVGMLGLNLLIASIGIWCGATALRGIRTGLWCSFGLFGFFALFCFWGVYWSLKTVSELDMPPLVQSSVIGYAVLCAAWMVIGVLLQIHALCIWERYSSTHRT